VYSVWGHRFGVVGCCVWGDRFVVVAYCVWETGVDFQGIVCGVTNMEF